MKETTENCFRLFQSKKKLRWIFINLEGYLSYRPGCKKDQKYNLKGNQNIGYEYHHNEHNDVFGKTNPSH